MQPMPKNLHFLQVQIILHILPFKAHFRVLFKIWDIGLGIGVVTKVLVLLTIAL